MRRAVSGYTIPLRAIGLVMALVLLAACGPAATPTLTAPVPEAGAEWDLVALGDSTPRGYGVQESYVNIYAEYIDFDLGVTVTVHNRATNRHQTTGDHLEALRTNQELRNDIREAEVITIWLGWHDVVPRVGTTGNNGLCTMGQEPDLDCIREIVTPMQANFDAILAEILSLRSTSDTLIRIADVANPFVDEWKEVGTFEELKGPAFEDWSNYIVQSAEKYNIPVVHSYRVLNGRSGDEAVPAEYLQADGIHFNKRGHILLADLHRELGYEPLGP